MATRKKKVDRVEDEDHDVMEGYVKFDVRWIDENGRTIHIFHDQVESGTHLTIDPLLSDGLYKTEGIIREYDVDVSQGLYVEDVVNVEFSNPISKEVI